MQVKFAPVIVMIAFGVLARFSGAADVEIPPMKFDRLALYDVHGLWGGRNVYVAQNGTMWVQVSRHVDGKPGFQETRSKVLLKPADVAVIEKLLAEHHFADITVKDRPGIPDEARPVIEIAVGGKTITKSKWANDVNMDFTAIYEALLAFASRSDPADSIYTGPFDWKWRPEGFDYQPPK